MSSRFSRLERDATAGDGEAPAAPEAPAFRRAIELDGRIALDDSGPRTDFCRSCGAENREGVKTCFSCGGPLGGPEQEAFDERIRAERAARLAAARDAREGADAAEAAHAEVSPAALPPERRVAPGTDALLERILTEAEQRDAPGFGAVVASGVVSASIFALVWIPVRLAFAASRGEALPWRAFVEIGLAAAIGFLLRRAYRSQLERF